ncbi:anti-sigma-I factor RsgI-like [Schistocerca piceifrons]|uniref:anti-sigma-I factor RsgI-like n=1 Tax=Schistocerca piceifrons TaxID=274613 RepID=UPI001F5FE4EA|nr:anti-sigma-I factor RsgI-like [Schistocerca piceifrons]
MTALKVLSLTGNRGLQCDFVKAQFKQARPDLQVICEDSAGDTLSSVFPSDEERTSEKSLYEPHSTINNTKSIIDDEKTTSEKSFTESDFTIKNTKNITGDEKHTSEQSLTESDFTINTKNITDDEKHNSEKSLTESDSAIGKTIKDNTDDIKRNESDIDRKNKEKDTNANTAFGIETGIETLCKNHNQMTLLNNP